MNLDKLLNRNENPRFIDFEIIYGQSVKLENPILENEMKCRRCGHNVGYVCLNDPLVDLRLCWFCSKPDCVKHSAEISKKRERLEWIKRMAKINPDFERLIPNDEISNINRYTID